MSLIPGLVPCSFYQWGEGESVKIWQIFNGADENYCVYQMRLEFKPISRSIFTYLTYFSTQSSLLTRIVVSGQFTLSDISLMTPGIWRNVLSIREFIRRIQTLLTPPAMPGVSNDLQFYLIILWRKYQVVEKTIIIYLRSEQTTVRYIQNY